MELTNNTIHLTLIYVVSKLNVDWHVSNSALTTVFQQKPPTSNNDSRRHSRCER